MKINLAIATALAAVSFNLQASDVTDIAKVVSATPVIEKVAEPARTCATEAALPSAPLGEAPCLPVEAAQEVITGYKVVYRYNGLDATAMFPYNPGDFITVGVAAIPDAPR